MRIAQPVRPDLLAGTVDRRERVVVRDAVATVLAEGARGRVLAEIRDDAEDLADERVEPLRVQAAAVTLLAGARVACAEVHDAPIRIAGARDRIERHFAKRVDWQRMLHPQQLAGGPLERVVRRIAILPLDQHDLAFDVSVHGRRWDRWRRGITLRSRPATTPLFAAAGASTAGSSV